MILLREVPQMRGAHIDSRLEQHGQPSNLLVLLVPNTANPLQKHRAKDGKIL